METTKKSMGKLETPRETPRRKPRKSEKDKTFYIVKTKGYKETFTSLDRARNQLEVLKKRAVKNKNKVKIQIFEKTKGNQELLDEVHIGECFYGEQ